MKNRCAGPAGNRCADRQRVEQMLAGPEGTVHPQLAGLRGLLLSDNTPDQIYDWLDGTKWAQLLTDLAHTGEPITHDAIDAGPQLVEVQYRTQLLVSAGVLAARENNLDSVEAWLAKFLVDKRRDAAAHCDGPDHGPSATARSQAASASTRKTGSGSPPIS
jgi:hypothetical protein